MLSLSLPLNEISNTLYYSKPFRRKPVVSHHLLLSVLHAFASHSYVPVSFPLSIPKSVQAHA
jgi:hypothetical protein